MATLKHIASKNSDYTAIEAYLIYQHDEFTGKQLLDEQGKPKLRESYLLDTLECGDFSFATACLLANRKYGKNTQHGDIKSHQYIISFDPRDAADNGLTMEKAQALGLKFCEENFPGHPAIVCTHPDGHNHSGNIHVHIVIGSIRMREVERKPYAYLKGFAPETIATAILFSMVGYFNGNDKTLWVMVQGLVQTLLVRLPMAYIMSIQPNASLTMIGLSAPTSTAVGILLNICFFLWLKRYENQTSA